MLIGILLALWQSLAEAPSSSPATRFSSQRAFGVLSALLKEQVPHPTGSAQNTVVRDRVMAELVSYGYQPEIQKTLQCAPPDRFPGCTLVENIIAVRKGTGGGDAILATAHYDSVPAGPGVADDGAGVAVMLELARELRGDKPARNDIIFLFTDGEETGLRGAVAFARQHPLMKSVRLVVNVESRGDTGPSIMFETGPGNAALIGLMASVMPKPVSNSLAYEIYRLLPNDTDFTIYKSSGLSGYNFAMIGSASRYHSPRDDLAHLDIRTLQHHGDHALALVEKLQDTDLATLKSGADASYFDLMGHTMMVWPASLNLPIAVIALLGILGLVVANRSSFGWMSTSMGIGSILLALALLYACGWLLSYPLALWPGVHPLDNPEPLAARIALLSAAILVAAGISALVSSRVPEDVSSLLAWTFLGLLGVVCAAYLPGAAYALIWPALIFALKGWGVRLVGMRGHVQIASAVGFAALAFFWISHFVALDAVLGFNMSGLKLVALFPVVLALVTLLSPAQGRTIVLAGSALVMFAAAAAASQTPGFSWDHPRPMNFLYYDDQDAAKPRWLVTETPVDHAFMKAAGFSSADETLQMLGIFEVKGRLRPAENMSLRAPVLTAQGVATDKGVSMVSATLQSGRGGFVMGLAVPPGSGLQWIDVEGQRAVGAERLSAPGGVNLRLFGLGLQPVHVTLAFDPKKPASVVVFERSALPEGREAQELLASRPHDANQVHSGDGALVFRTVDLRTLVPTSASDRPAP